MNEREALLQAVCDNPDDDTPRLVFADWLQENGEEDRAEFIRVQIEIARDRDNSKLKKREKALLARHGERWSAPLRETGAPLVAFQRAAPQCFQGIEYRRGFPYGVQFNEEKAEFAERAAELFRCAPIQRIAFYNHWGYEKLAMCPELLRLKSLSFDRTGFETRELAVLFGSKFLKHVTHLELIADDDNGHLAAGGLELLSAARNLPALRHLDLSSNWSTWQFPSDFGWVSALLKGRLVERLESLWLRSTWLADEGAEILAHSERVRSLQHLNLSGNTIAERGLYALAISQELKSLKILDLRDNRYESGTGTEVLGCTPGMRRFLESRLGSKLLLDGDPEPHPLP